MISYKKLLIEAGVKNLKTFGYTDVDTKNILTDRVYSAFFDQMLEEHKGNKKAVKELRDEIARNKNPKMSKLSVPRLSDEL